MIAKALQEAARLQIKFHNREDSELQQVKADAWEKVEEAIEQLINRKLDELTAPAKKQKRG